jgi:hypothetical protein
MSDLQQAADDFEQRNAERWRQYQVCKQRGHQESGTTLTSNPPWHVCKHCGTNFRYERRLVESNAPNEPPEESQQCAHGNNPADCNACAVLSDIAYDTARENDRFGR